MAACALLAWVRPLAAQVQVLPPLEISATRGVPLPEDLPVEAELFSADQLQFAPAGVTLDDTLRDDPSFSLFRRTTSLISNPTSQGVSLREIGPSGASRSLVLLDGIPLNDPFGGWVVWSQVPRLSLAQAEIIDGGGSGVWGDTALAGSITMIEAGPPPGEGRAEFDYGAFDTRSAEIAASDPLGPGTISLDARAFATDGFYDLTPADRGPVDRPFNSDHRLAQLDVREPLGPALEAHVSARIFDEERGNGTVLQNNTTHSSQVAVTLDGTPSPGFDWSAVTYVERETFSAFFTSVSANRATETPADDQFDVPATAAGAAITAHWRNGPGTSTSVGADFRQVVGETREDFDYSGDAFTRVRYAGGTQDFAGIFVHHEHALTKTLELTLDGRIDQWVTSNGHDREYNLANGAPTLLDYYPRHSGEEFSPNAGLVWKPIQHIRFHAAAYRGFRVPTLNEDYRPYRVGSVTTDANPNLKTETMYGGEAGCDATAGPFQAGLTAFADELNQAVGTITLSQTPTSTVVQRANLGAVQVRGLEAFARWKIGSRFSLRAGYLYNDSTIEEAPQADLVGLRLPEVPRQTVTAEADAIGPFAIKAALRLRWISMQFDDNANTLRLPAAAVADAELSRRFGRRLEVYLAMENLANAPVATSLSGPGGIYTYDAPRLLETGLRLAW